MDRSSWIPMVLLIAAAGCAENAVPSKDVQQVPTTSEYRRPERATPVAVDPVDTPILPEVASEPSGNSQVTVASASVPASPATEEPAAPSEKAVSPAADSTTAENAASPIGPRPLTLLIPEKAFQKTTGGELRVSFDDLDLLKVLDAEPVPVDVVDHFPSWLKDLSGKVVRLRGFMKPPPREKELPFFLFVRDSKDCCFGANVKIYDQVAVKMKPGTTTDYIHMRPFDVTGKFVIKSVVRDGKLMLLYQLEDATVLDKS